MTTLGLPALPPLPAESLERHAVAHERLADALQAVNPIAQDLFRYVQMRLVLEAAASVTPIHSRVRTSLLVPPRRRLLSPAMRLRLEGCREAIRHLDVRATMRNAGHVSAVLDVETPMVVNALVESRNPSQRETNCGLPRATPTWFDPTETDFRPPPGSEVRRLLLEALEVVDHVPAPPLARAGWLAVTLFAVHPFVDGNGRTARLLFNAVNSAGLRIGFDWGSLERWAANRRSYIDAIQQTTPDLATYDAERIDPLPFMMFAARKSAEGADLCVRRIEALADFVERQRAVGLANEEIVVLGAVAADRNLVVDDLRTLPIDLPMARQVLHDLAHAGLVWRQPGTGWQVTGENWFRYLSNGTDQR